VPLDPSIPRMLARLPHVRRVGTSTTSMPSRWERTAFRPMLPQGQISGYQLLNNDGSIDGEFSIRTASPPSTVVADPGRANEIMVSSIVAQSLDARSDVVPIGFYTNVQTTLPATGLECSFHGQAHLRMT